MWFGGGRGSGNVVIALIGSGVGACVVADGTPYRGASSSAGEWGHTTLRVGGRTCRCGSRGCLEAYVGAEALLGRWPGAPEGVSEETGLAALLAAADDDPEAAALLAEAAEYLGAGIADLINLFNPQRIVIGGWAGPARPPAAARGPRGRRRVRPAPPLRPDLHRAGTARRRRGHRRRGHPAAGPLPRRGRRAHGTAPGPGRGSGRRSERRTGIGTEPHRAGGTLSGWRTA